LISSVNPHDSTPREASEILDRAETARRLTTRRSIVSIRPEIIPTGLLFGYPWIVSVCGASSKGHEEIEMTTAGREGLRDTRSVDPG
jgi:hypothetical protein